MQVIPRQAFLRAGIAGLLVPAAAGCSTLQQVRWVPTPEPTPSPSRDADDDVRERAVATSSDLVRLATTFLTGRPEEQSAADPVVSELLTCLTAHLAALGADPGAPPGTAGQQVTGQQLLDALAAAVAEAMADVGASVTGGMARLQASLATSRALATDALVAALGAAVLAPQLPATPTTEATGPDEVATEEPDSSDSGAAVPDTVAPQTTAVQRALAGEHAAVFAYGLVAARSQRRRGAALAELDAHRQVRDDLSALVVDLGADPVQSEASYDVAAADEQQAVAVAAGVEERLAAVYADVVAATTTHRALATDGLLRSARAALRWGPVASFSWDAAFPGITTVPGAA